MINPNNTMYQALGGLFSDPFAEPDTEIEIEVKVSRTIKFTAQMMKMRTAAERVNKELKKLDKAFGRIRVSLTGDGVDWGRI